MINEIEIIKDKNNFAEKTNSHPCYGDNAHQFGRMHIPVAPKCNISCNYCVRKFDCVNESRPGVTSEVLTPEKALEKFKFVRSKIDNLTVLGIAGPGDALANFEETKKSIELIREEAPDVTFCLSTNGLMLPLYASRLIEFGVSHVTVTMNAVDKKIGAKIYREVNYLGNKYTGEEAAEILLNNQLSGLKYLCSKGIICKVNIVMIKGINDHHIVDVVKKAKELGVYMTNIMQLIPVEGSVFQDLPLTTTTELNEKRKECEGYMKQMYHCKQCRADAIGTLGDDKSADFKGFSCGSDCGNSCDDKAKTEEEIKLEQKNNYKFAIASKTGINIDEHFGHASEFYIYSFDEKGVQFIEKREIDKYCTGNEECDGHEDKIKKILNVIDDCDIVLTLRAGLEPVKKMEDKGIKVIQMYASIKEGIEKVVEELKR